MTLPVVRLALQAQWLGPSWLPAMHRVSIVHPGRLYEEARESGSVVHGDGATEEFAGATQPTKIQVKVEVPKPSWWRALDSEFGKDFLDDLQLHVVQGRGTFLVRSERSVQPQRPVSHQQRSRPLVADTAALHCAKQEYGRARGMARDRCRMWWHKQYGHAHRDEALFQLDGSDTGVAWNIRVAESRTVVDSLPCVDFVGNYGVHEISQTCVQHASSSRNCF